MDLQKILTEMETAALKAGNLLVKMQPWAKRLPSSKDLVTDADLKSEKAILESLRAKYPDIPSFAEESGGKDSREGYLWIVDPIDGTFNFFRQDDHWGVSIALACNGKTVAGVVYLPKKGQLFSAAVGKQATELSGKPPLRRRIRMPQKGFDILVGWGKEKSHGRDHKKVYSLIAKLDRKSDYKFPPQIRGSATAEEEL